jgi:hypothetical protein
MATLTRQETVVDESISLLNSTVPHPFPRSAVEQERYFRDHNLSVLTRTIDNSTSAEGSAHEVAIAKLKESATPHQKHSLEDARPAESVVSSSHAKVYFTTLTS